MTDRFNGYRQRDVLTAAGYGRQFLNGQCTASVLNSVCGVRYDEHTDDTTETQPLGYASGSAMRGSWLTAGFTQGCQYLAQDTTLNSETASMSPLTNILVTKVGYNLTVDSRPPESAPEHTDRRTTVTLGYKM